MQSCAVPRSRRLHRGVLLALRWLFEDRPRKVRSDRSLRAEKGARNELPHGDPSLPRKAEGAPGFVSQERGLHLRQISTETPHLLSFATGCSPKCAGNSAKSGHISCTKKTRCMMNLSTGACFHLELEKILALGRRGVGRRSQPQYVTSEAPSLFVRPDRRCRCSDEPRFSLCDFGSKRRSNGSGINQRRCGNSR